MTREQLVELYDMHKEMLHQINSGNDLVPTAAVVRWFDTIKTCWPTWPTDRDIELAEADAEGRVVVLPCNVGDIVYVLHRRGNTAFITEEAVTSIKITRGRIA